MTRSTKATRVLAALLAAGLLLVGVELGLGALGYGERSSRDACAPPASAFDGRGVDGAVQRVVLDGLDGAACELDTTREQLVLSFGPTPGGAELEWDEATIERAVRAGLERSIAAAEERGDVPAPVAGILRELAERAPVAWLVGTGGDVAAIVDALRGLSELPGDLLEALRG